MLSIDYFGRTGNQIFQMCFARLLAKKNGLGIITQPPQFFYPIKSAEPGKLNMNVEEVVFSDEVRQDHTRDWFSEDHTKSNIRLHGYFQSAEYYNDDRDEIKGYFELPKIERNYDDIVVHLRLTDYFWSRVRSVISPRWYFDILDKEKFRKLYVVAEDHPTSKKYLSYFKSKYRNFEFVSGSAASDFDFIRNFDRIVCSNSTYAWWAAFLSDASKIWTFKKWMHNDRVPLENMVGAKVVDGDFFRDPQLEVLDWTDYWHPKKMYEGM